MFLFNLVWDWALKCENVTILQLKVPSFLALLSIPEPTFASKPALEEALTQSFIQNDFVNPISDLAAFEGSYSALFANISFLLLFLAMTVYWINLAFFDKQSSQTVSFTNTQQVAVSITGAMQSSSTPNATTLNKNLKQSFMPKLGLKAPLLGKFIVLAANISLVLLLSSRWIESSHFPLSNLYESLMFLSWSCTTIYLILIYTNVKGNLFIEKLMGAILTPCALFLNAFATFSLPQEMQQAGPLVPALQSNWLMMHVTVMIISYAALILGSLLSIAFLIYNIAKFGFTATLLQSSPSIINNNQQVDLTTTQVSPSKNKIGLTLDYLSYRIIGIGFPFLTIGILSGAVWANEAWGSYWSWDPKETWALLTWLVFAIYLHTRFTKGWDGSRPAIIASVGFIVVWICYLGVNLLGEGLHSYGFFSGN